MKKFYSIMTLAFVLGLVLNFPLNFYGQEKEGDAEVSKDKIKLQSSFTPYWFLQGEIGPTFSHADLSISGFGPDFGHVGINGQLGFGRQFTSVISAYGNLERGFFNGEKENVIPQNITVPYGTTMNYDNDYYGGNLNLGINLSNLIGGYKDRLVGVAIHAGVGQVQWKSRTYNTATGNEITSYGYSDSPSANQGNGINNRKVALTVPVGAMVNFNVSPKWDIYGDYTYNWMDTDLADGIVHGAMQVYNDVYSHFNIGLRFKFGSNKIKDEADDFGLVTLKATPDPLEEVGDSVEITIIGTFPPKYFEKDAVMCFTPVLEGTGTDFVLETMNFKGENVEGDGQMISYADGGSFTYKTKVPYDPAMYNSDLVVAPVFYKYNGTVYEDCGDASLKEKTYIAEPRNLAVGVINTEQFVRNTETIGFAPDRYEKVTIVTQTADLFFPVNVATLNVNMPLNKANVDARNNMLVDVAKRWDVKDINIAGWASPEGEETFNQGLSQKRSVAAEKYLNDAIAKLVKDKKLTKDEAAKFNFVKSANGPDWNGFMKAIEKSDLKDKNAILNVVNAATAAKKEEEIRNMILIYPELERDILPPLRRANMQVTTFEPKKSDMQIAEYSISSPDSLTLNELLFAATLTDDLNTKKQIYANTMSLFPKCWRAVVNAAGVELQLGNLDEAKALLDKAAGMNNDSYELQNNFAAYYLKMGDYKTAETYLVKAKNLGADVDYNLGIVYINNGKYAQAVQMLSPSKCDFNLGLAQLLNKQNSAAETTFNCVQPQDAETYYMLAITGAHMDDKEKALGYLSQSIKMDDMVKLKASTDREFYKYYNDADFRALVGIGQ
jgi:tetratricopeptide (TPR) repeat protein